MSAGCMAARRRAQALVEPVAVGQCLQTVGQRDTSQLWKKTMAKGQRWQAARQRTTLKPPAE
jgi:hypothetical protein